MRASAMVWLHRPGGCAPAGRGPFPGLLLGMSFAERFSPALAAKSKRAEPECADQEARINQAPTKTLLHLRGNEEADEEFYGAGGDFRFGQGAEDILEHERSV